jgi:hypothetical protein
MTSRYIAPHLLTPCPSLCPLGHTASSYLNKHKTTSRTTSAPLIRLGHFDDESQCRATTMPKLLRGPKATLSRNYVIGYFQRSRVSQRFGDSSRNGFRNGQSVYGYWQPRCSAQPAQQTSRNSVLERKLEISEGQMRVVGLDTTKRNNLLMYHLQIQGRVLIFIFLLREHRQPQDAKATT